MCRLALLTSGVQPFSRIDLASPTCGVDVPHNRVHLGSDIYPSPACVRVLTAKPCFPQYHKHGVSIDLCRGCCCSGRVQRIWLLPGSCCLHRYGVGGEYPMAAGSAAERAETGGIQKARFRGREVVLTFSMQARHCTTPLTVWARARVETVFSRTSVNTHEFLARYPVLTSCPSFRAPASSVRCKQLEAWGSSDPDLATCVHRDSQCRGMR